MIYLKFCIFLIMQLLLHVSVRTCKSQLNILQTMLQHFRNLKEFFDTFHRKSNSFLHNIKIYSPVETCCSYLIPHLFVSHYGERSEVFWNQSEIKPHNPSTQLEETNADLICSKFQHRFIFKWTGTNIHPKNCDVTDWCMRRYNMLTHSILTPFLIFQHCRTKYLLK